jgi:hypothetical protein
MTLLKPTLFIATIFLLLAFVAANLVENEEHRQLHYYSASKGKGKGGESVSPSSLFDRFSSTPKHNSHFVLYRSNRKEKEKAALP